MKQLNEVSANRITVNFQKIFYFFADGPDRKCMASGFLTNNARKFNYCFSL